MRSTDRPMMWSDPQPGAGTAEARFHLPAGTVTFLMSDIEGSTRLWSASPEEMGSAVGQVYAIIDRAVRRYDGVRPVEQGEGDSVVGAFARASDALAAALEAQVRFAAESWPDGSQLRVRMAIHTGESELRDEGNYFGPAIIRCARLRAIGAGGQVLVSGATADLVSGRLPAEASLVDLGLHRLKDLGRPERVFEARHPGIPARETALQSL